MRSSFDVGAVKAVRPWLGALLLLAVFALPLAAQTQATISGFVTDPSGASIPAALVTATNTATGISRVVHTDAQGRYFIPALNIGTYTVSAQAKGFKSARQTGVVLNVGAKVGLNLKLSIGSSSETVTVAADAAHLQTESGAISDVVSGKQIQSIAVNGRNFISLATLVPGASSGLADNPGVGHLSNNISFNGSRQQSNNWQVDGAQDVDAGSQGSMMTSPAMEAVGQFRVVTSNYSAEYGSAGGAVIDVALKSGTNQWHGGAYEFVRNDALDARNAFDKNGKTPLKLNDFGFTVGGPIKKNKSFIFYSQEWRRNRQGTTFNTRTASAAELAGDFSHSPTSKKDASGNPILVDPTGKGCITGFQVNPGCFDPNALALFQSGAFPAANYSGSGFNNFLAASSTPTNYSQELVRVDHNLTNNLILMGHYIHENFDEVTPTTQWGGQSFPTITTDFVIPSNNLMVKLTQIVNPTLVNEFNFNLSTDHENGTPIGAFARPSNFNVPQLFPENPGNRIPSIGLSQGYGSVDVGEWPKEENYNRLFTFNDMVTETMGRHTLKFGGLYEYQVKNQVTGGNTQGSFGFNGSVTGNSLLDFLLGYPSSYSELNTQIMGHYRFEQVEAFIQDDFKVSPTLTLNFGVRWFLIPHVYDKYNELTNFVPSQWNPALAPQLNAKGNIVPGTGDLMNGLVQAGSLGVPRGLTNTYYNNWGPRIGFSWDPWGHGTTVIRGGYGVGYYREQGNDIYSVTNNPPFVQDVSLSYPTFDNPGGGTAVVAAPNLTAFNPNYKNPMTQQYSLGVQRQVGHSTLLTLSYVGSSSQNLTNSIQLNQPMPVTGYNFNPALNGNVPQNLYRPYVGYGSITMHESQARSQYNSLQVNLEKQMTHHLRFQAAYTLSKSMDDASAYNQTPQNSYNLNAEWALSDFDRTHVLQVNYIYDLPFFQGQQGLAGEALGGWELAGLTTLESGTPLTIGLSGGGHGLATRPNVTGAITMPNTVNEWFDTSVFSNPAAGFFGNAGRNIVRGPGMEVFDLSLYKTFRVTERVNAQLRVEGFNILNHVNYAGVSTSLGSGNFGHLTSAHDPRILQLGVRLTF